MIDLPKPAIFAHRGASAYAPENTLSAFELALRQGADGIELDAKLSADGQVVVIHDQTVDRTTGAHGRVDQLSLAQLKALDAGSSFSPQFQGERIPTLEEVFATLGKRLLINVELTNYRSATDALVPKVAELVRRHGLQDWVLFSSFHPLNLLRARRLLPSVPAGFLLLPGKAAALIYKVLGRWLSPKFVHPYFADVDPAYLAAQRRLGRGVNVWTVNQAEDMRRLFDLGVDGIFTDDPPLAQKVLAVK